MVSSKQFFHFLANLAACLFCFGNLIQTYLLLGTVCLLPIVSSSMPVIYSFEGFDHLSWERITAMRTLGAAS